MIAQAEEMIDLMTRLDEIDIENDWKVITMFIGGNDLCGYCRYGIGDPEVGVLSLRQKAGSAYFFK